MKPSVILLCIAMILLMALYSFKPKGIDGPRVASVTVNTKQFPYEALDEVLAQLYPNGRSHPIDVRYDALRKNPKPLDQYLGLMSEVGPRSAPHRFTIREERLAYALNAYTAGLLALIRQHCPFDSLEDIYMFRGIFWRVNLRVGGELLNLNDLAAEINTLGQGDPRIHLALWRGSRSSLPPPIKAWRPENIEAELDALDQLLRTPPWVERKGDALYLGGPLQWYQHYFNPSPEGYLKSREPKILQGIERVFKAPINTQLDGRCNASN